MHNDIIGSIVTSKAGRDKGRTFVVTATEGEEFVMLADGETRRVSRPKKKKLKHLSFDVADDETFRCLAAAKKAIRKGGLGPCAANGANEEAVRLFLQDKIGFLDIGRLVEGMVDSDSFGGDYTLQDVYDCDRMARDYVKAHV